MPSIYEQSNSSIFSKFYGTGGRGNAPFSAGVFPGRSYTLESFLVLRATEKTEARRS